MTRRRRLLGAATLAAAAAIVFALPSAAAAPRPRRGVSSLVPTKTAPDASGRVDVRLVPRRGHTPVRRRMAMRVTGLEPGSVFSVWIDDPSTPYDGTLVDVGVALVADASGTVTWRVDTRLAQSFPFGAKLEDLGGRPLEIRDASGDAVLTGEVPRYRTRRRGGREWYAPI